jgi:hypothetical protein
MIKSIKEVCDIITGYTFVYEVCSCSVIDKESTIDVIQQHILRDFVGFECNDYELIYEKNNKIYFSMILEPENHYEEFDVDATPNNLKKYFKLSDDNKIVIPKTFKDEVYINHPHEKFMKTAFIFDKIINADSNSELFDYIVIQ